MLAHFEEDVVSFFKEWPTSVYISKLGSSFERMLLHALCQYLDLKSRSKYIHSISSELHKTIDFVRSYMRTQILLSEDIL